MERNTRQRQAVLDALARSGRTLSPPEILDLAQRQAPGLNLSTVYRQVKALEQGGAVVRVQLPGDAARFEVRCTGPAHGAGGQAGRASPATAGALATTVGHPGTGDPARGDGAAADQVAGCGEDHRPGHGHTPGHTHGQAHQHADGAEHHHHHFNCRSCDQVVPIHGCPGPMHDLAPPGFIVEQHDLVLHGRCAACASGGSRS